MNYICKKCNNDVFYTRKKNMVNGFFHIGLYCKKCNKWYKWISKYEIQKIKESR